mgnify:CR=1 FL=1
MEGNREVDKHSMNKAVESKQVRVIMIRETEKGLRLVGCSRFYVALRWVLLLLWEDDVEA